MKVRDVLKRLTREGWYLDRTHGDHQQFKHLTKPGLVTVTGHERVDLLQDTLRSVSRQAGLGRP